jgi:aminoglycoside phosphotransferase (APT) family kinase protein
VERSPLFLAALASAAVPGLDPASVEALPSAPGQLFDVAFVEDTLQRRWVVRAPRTPGAAAQMDLTVSLLSLLARRLPFALPMPRGFITLRSGGRAAVYPYLPGQHLDFASLPAGNGIAAELGRAIAALHSVDQRLFDEAGLPTYDADTYRIRRLSDLDRAAESGRVPAALLARWERALENVNLWRFAPTPIHGGLTGDQVLAAFDDQDDASSGRIKGVTGWEGAKVADPADDFAALVVEASPEAMDTVMEAYAHARAERPDPNLLVRARLAAELQRMSALLAALAAGESAIADQIAAELQDLDDDVRAQATAPDDHPISLEPRTPRTVVARPAQADEDAAAPANGEDVVAPANGEDATAADSDGSVDETSGDESTDGVAEAPDESTAEGEAKATEPEPEATEPEPEATEPEPEATEPEDPGLGLERRADNAEPGATERASQPEPDPDRGLPPRPEPEPESHEPATGQEPALALAPAPRTKERKRMSRVDRDASPARVLPAEPAPPLEFEIDQPDDPPRRRRS